MGTRAFHRRRVAAILALGAPLAAVLWLGWGARDAPEAVGCRIAHSEAPGEPSSLTGDQPWSEGSSGRCLLRGTASPRPTDDLVSVTAVVQTDDGKPVEAEIRAGETAESLLPWRTCSSGQTVLMLVPAATRCWRATALGRGELQYEPCTVRCRAVPSELHFVLPRGRARVSAQLRDEAGHPVAAVPLLLATDLGNDVGCTDSAGIVLWTGLRQAVSDREVRVHGVPWPTRAEPLPGRLVTWDAGGLEGTVRITLRWRAASLTVRCRASEACLLDRREGMGWCASDADLLHWDDGETRLEWDVPTPGMHRLTAVEESGEVRQATIDLALGDKACLEALQTVAVTRVHGRVVGPGVKALGHLLVERLDERSATPARGAFRIAVREDGVFDLPRWEGLRRVRVRDDVTSGAGAWPDNFDPEDPESLQTVCRVWPREFDLEHTDSLRLESAAGLSAEARFEDRRGTPMHVRVTRASVTRRQDDSSTPPLVVVLPSQAAGLAAAYTNGPDPLGLGLPGKWSLQLQVEGRASTVEVTADVTPENAEHLRITLPD